VPTASFALFLEAVNGNDIQITSANHSDLSQLCTEFDNWCLSAKIEAFNASPEQQLSRLSDGIALHDGRIARLEAALQRLTDINVEAIVPKLQEFSEAVQGERTALWADIALLKSCAFPRLDSQIVSTFPSVFD
jgi:hypothetical protein